MLIMMKNMHAIHFNEGNSLLKEQKTDLAIESFKEALRKNPNDDDARFNLAYAQMKENEDQENKDQENEDQENKDQENEDQENKDQENEDQENKDQEKNDQAKE